MNKIESELLSHLHTREDLPDAIPYICRHTIKGIGAFVHLRILKTLNEKQYRVVIDSSFKKCQMDYGECLIPGKSRGNCILNIYMSSINGE